MPEYPCQYVVARFVPDRIRDEARNFGVILQCASIGYSNVRFDPDLSSYSRSAVDRKVLAAYITECHQFVNRSLNLSELLPGMLDAKSVDVIGRITRFNGGSVQFTEPRGCVSRAPDETLAELYDLLVAPPIESGAGTIDMPIEARRVSHQGGDFLRQCWTYFKTNQTPARARFKVTMEGKDLPFDFGYKTPATNGYMLCEAVDFTKTTIANRVNAIGPTVVKFDIAKTVLGARAFRCAVVKQASHNGNGKRGTEHKSLEFSRLIESCDQVFNFQDGPNMQELLDRMKRDMETQGFKI